METTLIDMRGRCVSTERSSHERMGGYDKLGLLVFSELLGCFGVGTAARFQIGSTQPKVSFLSISSMSRTSTMMDCSSWYICEGWWSPAGI